MKVEFELNDEEVAELVRRELTEQIEVVLKLMTMGEVNQYDIVTLAALKHVVDYYSVGTKLDEGK